MKKILFLFLVLSLFLSFGLVSSFNDELISYGNGDGELVMYIAPGDAQATPMGVKEEKKRTTSFGIGVGVKEDGRVNFEIITIVIVLLLVLWFMLSKKSKKFRKDIIGFFIGRNNFLNRIARFFRKKVRQFKQWRKKASYNMENWRYGYSSVKLSNRISLPK